MKWDGNLVTIFWGGIAGRSSAAFSGGGGSGWIWREIDHAIDLRMLLYNREEAPHQSQVECLSKILLRGEMSPRPGIEPATSPSVWAAITSSSSSTGGSYSTDTVIAGSTTLEESA